MHPILRLPLFVVPLLLMLGAHVQAQSTQPADPARLEAFLQVTGFDVALESIRLSADSAPQLLGLSADDFGSEWSRLVNDVFETQFMHDMALEILGKTLSDDLLTHAAEFYASDLGQRLVIAENASHMVEEDGLKDESGTSIIDGLVRIGSPRVALLTQLNNASNVEDSSIRAIQEVQIRFLMAAAVAGVLDLQMDEADLREAFRAQEGEMRRLIQTSALANAAYTYQAFSDEDLAAYADALAAPKMQKVYELMNAVQYEVQANRFEEIAARLSSMRPSQEL